MINDKLIKTMKMNKDERSKLINYFKDVNNRERLLKIFKPDSIDYFCVEENHKMKKDLDYRIKGKKIQRNIKEVYNH